MHFSCRPSPPRSIPVWSTLSFLVSTCFPLALCKHSHYSGKAGLWLLILYLFIISLRFMFRKVFLFNFQMKSQVKTHAFFCISLFNFSFLAPFKARINNTKITLMLSIFEVVVVVVVVVLVWLVWGFFVCLFLEFLYKTV